MTTTLREGSGEGNGAGAGHVTLEIIRNAYFAIVRQAGRIILRSSFSPIIRDAFDFCVTLVAPPVNRGLDLEIVAMNESLAHFSGVMRFMVQNLLWDYGVENLRPGDLIALNNPYKGGNHIYDNGFYKPVFLGDELVGGVAIKAHLMDMGGSAAGGYSVKKRSVWEDGPLISGLPVFKEGVPYVPGFNMYLENTRLPNNMIADLQALNSAASFAEHRLLALVERYGAATVHEAMAYSLDYADRSMRAGVSAIPDGDYYGEDGLDADAYNDRPYRIRASVKKRGELIEVDFSGTTREAESSINCSAYDAANGVYTAVKFLCDPHNPNNSGAFRCIDVVIPEGTFISAGPPAPTTMYFDAAEAAFNAVVRALNGALGEQGLAGHYGTNMGLLVTGTVDGTPAREPDADDFDAEGAGERPTPARSAGIFIAPFFALGGFGATSSGDGENFVSMSQQNLMDMSAEATEEDFPIVVLSKEFVADTGGPGTYRGGAGVVTDRMILNEAELRPLLLHMRVLPWGAFGGGSGRPGGAWIGEPGHGPERGPAERFRPVAGTYDEQGVPVAPGEGEWVFGLVDFQVQPETRFRILTPGAGGWGDPFERDTLAVVNDVRDGFVSIAGARRDYGVVVVGDPETAPEALTVDEDETAAIRAATTADRGPGNQRHRPPLLPDELEVERTLCPGETCPACASTALATYPLLSPQGWLRVTRCQSCLHVVTRQEAPTPMGFNDVRHGADLREYVAHSW
jgi:N-methylhydantoinase B